MIHYIIFFPESHLYNIYRLQWKPQLGEVHVGLLLLFLRFGARLYLLMWPMSHGHLPGDRVFYRFGSFYNTSVVLPLRVRARVVLKTGEAFRLFLDIN